MKKNKLYNLLKSLKKKEFILLEGYLKRHNDKNSKKVFELYRELKRFWPNLESEELNKSQLFNTIFPNTAFEDQKIRTLFSQMTKIVENYLIKIEFKEDGKLKAHILNKIYLKRNVQKEFIHSTNQLLGQLNKEKQKGAPYYARKFSLEKERYFNTLPTELGKIQSIFEDAKASFHNYLALEYARFELETINRNRIYNQDLKVPPITYDKTLTEDNIALKIYNQTNELLSNETEKEFSEIQNLFFQNIELLNTEDKVNIHMALQNYATQRSNRIPSMKYVKETLHGYKMAMNYDLIKTNNEISDSTYSSIVISSIRANEYDWVESFMKENINNVNEKNRKDIQYFTQAAFHYGKKEYDKVVETLRNSKLRVKHLNLNAKAILLRSLFKVYQTDESYHNITISNCKAFEQILKNDKVTNKQRKERYLKLIKFIRQMTHLWNRRKWNSSRKKKLLEEVKAEANVLSKDWLIEILEA